MIDAFAWGSIVEGGPLDTESELDRRLSVGASISCRIRGAIRDKLGQTLHSASTVQAQISSEHVFCHVHQ